MWRHPIKSYYAHTFFFSWGVDWVTLFCVTCSKWLFNGCYSYKITAWKGISLKLNALLCIQVPFMTLLSCHLQVSDNSDKLLEKVFNSIWLIDETHFVTHIFCVLKTAFLPATRFINHYLSRKCLHENFSCKHIKTSVSFWVLTHCRNGMCCWRFGKTFSILVHVKNKYAGCLPDGRKRLWKKDFSERCVCLYIPLKITHPICLECEGAIGYMLFRNVSSRVNFYKLHTHTHSSREST